MFIKICSDKIIKKKENQFDQNSEWKLNIQPMFICFPSIHQQRSDTFQPWWETHNSSFTSQAGSWGESRTNWIKCKSRGHKRDSGFWVFRCFFDLGLIISRTDNRWGQQPQLKRRRQRVTYSGPPGTWAGWPDRWSCWRCRGTGRRTWTGRFSAWGMKPVRGCAPRCFDPGSATKKRWRLLSSLGKFSMCCGSSVRRFESRRWRLAPKNRPVEKRWGDVFLVYLQERKEINSDVNSARSPRKSAGWRDDRS